MTRATRPLRLVEVRGEAYRVESGSGDAVSLYWVSPNRLRCDCRAGQRRRHCRHLSFVLEPGVRSALGDSLSRHEHTAEPVPRRATG